MVLDFRNSLTSQAMTNVAGNALIGFLATTAFTSLNPFTGALFGSFAGITFSVVDYAGFCFLGDSPCAKTIRVCLAFFASIALSAILTSLLGYSLTFEAGLYLTGSMIATTMVISTLFRCCLRCTLF